jgi:hypothetical protein
MYRASLTQYTTFNIVTVTIKGINSTSIQRSLCEDFVPGVVVVVEEDLVIPPQGRSSCMLGVIVQVYLARQTAC